MTTTTETEALRLHAAAVAVTRRMLDDWIPDVEARGWWHVGSGMEGPGEPMTDPELAWICHVEAASAPPSPRCRTRWHADHLCRCRVRTDDAHTCGPGICRTCGH